MRQWIFKPTSDIVDRNVKADSSGGVAVVLTYADGTVLAVHLNPSGAAEFECNRTLLFDEDARTVRALKK